MVFLPRSEVKVKVTRPHKAQLGHKIGHNSRVDDHRIYRLGGGVIYSKYHIEKTLKKTKVR